MVEMVAGHHLVGPGFIAWEVGNAFSSMVKQHRLSLKDAQRGLTVFQFVPLRYLAGDLENAVSIAHASNLYAYDAYFLDCASRHVAPLLTLDRPLITFFG